MTMRSKAEDKAKIASMNRGFIVGKVQYSFSAVVRFHGIYAGHLVNPIPIYHPRFPLNNVPIPLVFTGADQKFTIPFLWDAVDFGDVADARFSVFAIDEKESSKGYGSGPLVIGPDLARLWDSATQGMGLSGLLKLGDFRLAAAMKTMFSADVSTKNKLALGVTVIDVL